MQIKRAEEIYMTLRALMEKRKRRQQHTYTEQQQHQDESEKKWRSGVDLLHCVHSSEKYTHQHKTA
jgi:hypothetical protein